MHPDDALLLFCPVLLLQVLLLSRQQHMAAAPAASLAKLRIPNKPPWVIATKHSTTGGREASRSSSTAQQQRLVVVAAAARDRCGILRTETLIILDLLCLLVAEDSCGVWVFAGTCLDTDGSVNTTFSSRPLGVEARTGACDCSWRCVTEWKRGPSRVSGVVCTSTTEQYTAHGVKIQRGTTVGYLGIPFVS